MGPRFNSYGKMIAMIRIMAVVLFPHAISRFLQRGLYYYRTIHCVFYFYRYLCSSNKLFNLT